MTTELVHLTSNRYNHVVECTIMKKALITGITGQDGAYLTRFLLKIGYEVHGIKRRSSSFNTDRIDDIYSDEQYQGRFFLHYSDLDDSNSLTMLIQNIQPDEVYNLGAQSHVRVSFEIPEYTANTDALGVLRVLDAIRACGLEKRTKFYQASSSEMFGKVVETPQTETTPFYPRSPYGVAKVFGYWITKNYRESYGMFACNGILFNHESPLRGETFVTRKISRAVARISLGIQNVLELGNLDAKRDWGHASDYVEAMWMMLQHTEPDDYVVATGEQYSVREFVERAFAHVGVTIHWSGSGIDEVGTDATTGIVRVRINARYFRPAEVETLFGDPSKIKRILGWKPSVRFSALVTEMMEYDLNEAQKEKTMLNAGFDVRPRCE